MHVIAVANRKGGVGKSTLSAHLAVQAHRSQDGPVAILDTDPQGSLTAWWNLRKTDDIILVSPEHGVEAAVEECRRLGIGVLVIDTPGRHSEIIARVLGVSDVAVVPITPSFFDLNAAGQTVDLLDASRRQFVFVLNNANPQARITSEAATALSEHGQICGTIVRNRTDFRDCLAAGQVVVELNPSGKSAQEIAAVWKAIKSKLAKGARHVAAA